MGCRRSLALAVLLLTACTSPPTLPLYQHRSADPNLGAVISGELVVRGDCLFLDTGDTLLGLAWPSPGTEWQASSGGVSLSGEVAAPGSQIKLGGGQVSLTDEVSLSLEWTGTPDQSCLTDPMWFVGDIDREAVR